MSVPVNHQHQTSLLRNADSVHVRNKLCNLELCVVNVIKVFIKCTRLINKRLKWITVITERSMWTHFEGLSTKLLLTTYYDFLTRHLKNAKSRCFGIWKKRKIRILEHCFHPNNSTNFSFLCCRSSYKWDQMRYVFELSVRLCVRASVRVDEAFSDKLPASESYYECTNNNFFKNDKLRYIKKSRQHWSQTAIN